MLARRTSEQSITVVERGQSPIKLEPSHDPELTLEAVQDCAGVNDASQGQGCPTEVTAPLLSLRMEGPNIVLPAEGRPRCILASSSADLGTVDRAVVVAGEVSVPVSRDELRRVLSYAATRTVTLNAGEKVVRLRPGLRPTLYMHVGEDCASIPDCREGWLIAPLETVELDGESVRFCRGPVDVVAPVKDVSRAYLALKNTPPYRPRWGVGIDVGGPAVLFSVTGHWYPIEYLVLEFGVFPYSGEAIHGGWVGARLRIPLTDSLVSSVGGAASLLGRGDPREGEYEQLHAVGPRVALEYALPSRRDVLRFEAQLAYGNVIRPSEQSWYPWGGFGYVRWF